jgi:CRISPR-associated protein Cas2
MIIVSYDFQENRLRNRFSKFLKRYGRKVQYSVYEVKNSDRILRNILLEIEMEYSKEFKKSDSVIIIQLCKNCIDKIKRYGYSANEDEEVVFFN